MTVRSLPLKRTFAPLEVGCSPSPASITPDLTSSSLYFVIAPSISVVGISPASDSGLPGTRIMKRICVSLVNGVGFYPHVERGRPKSTSPGFFLTTSAAVASRWLSASPFAARSTSCRSGIEQCQRRWLFGYLLDAHARGYRETNRWRRSSDVEHKLFPRPIRSESPRFTEL